VAAARRPCHADRDLRRALYTLGREIDRVADIGDDGGIGVHGYSHGGSYLRPMKDRVFGDDLTARIDSAQRILAERDLRGDGGSASWDDHDARRCRGFHFRT
jgi:hypothetical protein